jgi:hypothetical protein
MKVGQIITLFCGVVLLLPGGLFLLIGVVGILESSGNPRSGFADSIFTNGFLISAGAAFCIWSAFRKRKPRMDNALDRPPRGPAP